MTISRIADRTPMSPLRKTAFITGAPQLIATIPEFFWELSLGIYLMVKGFKSSPITRDMEPTTAPPVLEPAL